MTFALLFLLPFIARKRNSYCYRNKVRRTITEERAIKKRRHEPMYIPNQYKKSKEMESDNYSVGGAKTIWGAIKKSKIYIAK